MTGCFDKHTVIFVFRCPRGNRFYNHSEPIASAQCRKEYYASLIFQMALMRTSAGLKSVKLIDETRRMNLFWNHPTQKVMSSLVYFCCLWDFQIDSVIFSSG